MSKPIKLHGGYELRQVTAEEMREFFTVEQYVFAEFEEVTDKQIADNPVKPEMTTAVFHKGKVVTTTAGLPFSMMLNGNSVKTDGVTAVGTLPDHTRQGLVRHTITHRLHQAKEANQPASILYATMAAIYQRFGYGLGCMGHFYLYNPRVTHFQFPIEDAGTVELTQKAQALPTIRGIYKEYIQDKNLMLERKEDWWNRVYASKKPFFVAIHRDKSGKPDGYISYSFKDYKPSKIDPIAYIEISVRDFFCLNEVAFRSIWEFLGKHDLVGKISMRTATDGLAPQILLEPRMLGIKQADGIWLRIVDVADLLSQRGYSSTGEVTFEITDDAECPWNVGKWHLEADLGLARVTQSNLTPDFQISINGLASLTTGQYSLTQLVRAGRARAHRNTDLGMVDRLFTPMHAPFCGDSF
ncbi:MAG: GNAT family N-acetyltransferase [Gammaproteobacteria bacterium]|nr:GNAT family N-acetyltransferase [Gammaproteobacteria bacterium]